jgi:uncharacterized membrane protein YqgA involved in biofilm formation
MLGTVVNTVAIIMGGLIGLMLKKGQIAEKSSRTIIQAISFSVIFIGLKSAFPSDDILLIILCLSVGALIGEALAIEDRLEALGSWFENRFSGAGAGFSKGFVAASLVYCVGSMAVVGAMESGLSGNHQTLYAKSMLDGISAVVFASTLGAGVLLSAFSVFVYQGVITLTAASLKPILTPAVVQQMSAVGGLLIVGIGFNLLEIKRIRIGNMLPAIVLPIIYYGMRLLFDV